MKFVLRFDSDESVEHPLYGRFATITPGAPGRCPDCDAFGFVDNLDLSGRFQNQHCPDCGCRWEYEFDSEQRIVQVRALAERNVLPRRPVERSSLKEVLDLTLADQAQDAPAEHSQPAS